MRADAEAVLFSLKCLLAAMLAYYIALRIGLTRPYWAVVTSYIIAQPLAGAVVSKAVFRLLGTLLGAAAAVILVPAFVDAPVVLTAALAAWLGLCVYVALLDRTPRAYVFLLAGYTASIIGLPSVDAPGAIFTTAILRVQEITLGILCASVVHGAIFPRTVTARLLARIDAILLDAERWTRDSLAPTRAATLDAERRRLAMDLGDLHQLSIHLPFDTARLLPRTRTVRALQDQLTLLLPLASTAEDRLAVLGGLPGGVPPPVAALIAGIGGWLIDAPTRNGGERDADAAALIARAQALEPAIVASPGWRDLLLLNLLARLGELVAAHRDARALRDQIRAPGARAISPRVAALLARPRRRTLHSDHWLAVRAALGTMATIAIGCAFWIGTAWADGAGAVLIAGITCALFGGLDAPGPAIRSMLVGSTVGLLAAIGYDYLILPAATDYVTVAAAVAPMLLLMGSLMGRPRTAGIGVGMVLGFPATVGFNASYAGNFAGAVNGALAQTIGIGFAVVTVGLFQTIGAEHRVARLVRAGWRDVARRAAGRAPDAGRWMSRMLDRVGLLVPRLDALPDGPARPLMDALADMRIGFVAGELHRLRGSLPEGERAALGRMLDGVRRHFAARDAADPRRPDDALLRDLDASVAACADDPQPPRRRDALVLLTSLRRTLFPHAPDYGAPDNGALAA